MKRCDALYSQPIEYDFSQQDDWDIVMPDVVLMTTETVDQFLNDLGDLDTFRDMDEDEREEYLADLLTENDHIFEPLSNGIYPLPRLDMEPAMAQAYLAGGNVVIVQVDDMPCLALSAGGMDYSWGLVEAYITLGYHPPICLSDLPNMGLSHDLREYAIIAEMKASLGIVRGHMDSQLARLDTLSATLRATASQSKPKAEAVAKSAGTQP